MSRKDAQYLGGQLTVARSELADITGPIHSSQVKHEIDLTQDERKRFNTIMSVECTDLDVLHLSQMLN